MIHPGADINGGNYKPRGRILTAENIRIIIVKHYTFVYKSNKTKLRRHLDIISP